MGRRHSDDWKLRCCRQRHTPPCFSVSHDVHLQGCSQSSTPSTSSAAFASKFRPEPSSSLTFAGTRAAAHSGVPVPTGGMAASRSAACFIVKGGLLALERRYRGCADKSEAAPLPPALRQESHRFDSVLRAGSALNNGGLWKNHYPCWMVKR